jgi:hypothetical protein
LGAGSLDFQHITRHADGITQEVDFTSLDLMPRNRHFMHGAAAIEQGDKEFHIKGKTMDL